MKNRVEIAQESMDKLLNTEIMAGQLAGAAVNVIYKGEKVIDSCLGYADIEKKGKVENDTIFRLYSMSKPIASVAAMIEIERGKLDLNAPISEYLPVFKEMIVCNKGSLVKAKKQILVKDLLNMTSGIVYPDMDEAGRYMEKLFSDVQERLLQGERISTQELCNYIAKQPLAFEPGEQWRYGLSVDVMGAILEVTSGMKLSEFYKKEIFEPLGMDDTGFWVETEKQNRFAQLYRYEDKKLLVEKERHLCLTEGLEPPSFESAGAGVLSTLSDYNKFAQMLVHYGNYHDVKILSRKSVEFFQQNHLTDAQLKTVYFETSIGYGYGNFMRVYDSASEVGTLGTKGEFGWDGWSGPYVTMNPNEDLSIVMMLQRCAYTNPALIRKVRNIAYSLI
jgi:CubicO group peptidase (beta-lactamase class C family)